MPARKEMGKCKRVTHVQNLFLTNVNGCQCWRGWQITDKISGDMLSTCQILSFWIYGGRCYVHIPTIHSKGQRKLKRSVVMQFMTVAVLAPHVTHYFVTTKDTYKQLSTAFIFNKDMYEEKQTSQCILIIYPNNISYIYRVLRNARAKPAYMYLYF